MQVNLATERALVRGTIDLDAVRAAVEAVGYGIGAVADQQIARAEAEQDSEAFEQAQKIDTIVLDKTGTLTQGKPVVITAIVPAKGFSEETMLRLAAAVEQGSEHPLAEAIVARAKELGLALSPASAFEAVAGHGIRAVVEDRVILLGNAALLAESGIEPGELAGAADELAGRGQTATRPLQGVGADQAW